MEKLKVGLLIDDDFAPNWLIIMLEKIYSSAYAEFSVIVNLRDNKQGAYKKSLVSKVVKNRKKLLYILYKKAQKKIRRVKPNAFTLNDINSVLNNIPKIDITTAHVNNEGIQALKHYKPDILLHIGVNTICDKVVSLAKYGVWSFDNEYYQQDTMEQWEHFEEWAANCTKIKILRSEHGNMKVYEAHMQRSLASDKLSNYYFESAKFLPDLVNKLSLSGEDFFSTIVYPVDVHPEFKSSSEYVSPTNIFIIKRLLKKSTNLFTNSFVPFVNRKLIVTIYKFQKRLSAYFHYNQWTLLFRLSTDKKLYFPVYKYKKMRPPAGKFWADPHVIHANNKYYIFIEEWVNKLHKGHISVIEMDEQGNCSSAKPVLEKEHHLSYPYVFRHEDKYYMIPETGRNNTVELYEAKEFPYQWEFKMNLMENIRAVDNTIFYHNNKWWLFNGRSLNDSSKGTELYLYYSEDLFNNNWTSHPQNPIITDINNARPAGKIFIYNNNIYRPAQICKPVYGWGIAINQITKLDENKYEEKLIDTIKPTWSKHVRQTHCLSIEGKLAVVDANVRRGRFSLRTPLFNRKITSESSYSIIQNVQIALNNTLLDTGSLPAILDAI